MIVDKEGKTPSDIGEPVTSKSKTDRRKKQVEVEHDRRKGNRRKEDNKRR